MYSAFHSARQREGFYQKAPEYSRQEEKEMLEHTVVYYGDHRDATKWRFSLSLSLFLTHTHTHTHTHILYVEKDRRADQRRNGAPSLTATG